MPGEGAPEGPAGLPPVSWWAAVRRTFGEFRDDDLGDWAAALTYYAVLSIFPAMLVVVSLTGLQRGRAIAGGMPEGREPYVEPRDTREFDDGAG